MTSQRVYSWLSPGFHLVVWPVILRQSLVTVGLLIAEMECSLLGGFAVAQCVALSSMRFRRREGMRARIVRQSRRVRVVGVLRIVSYKCWFCSRGMEGEGAIEASRINLWAKAV